MSRNADSVKNVMQAKKRLIVSKLPTKWPKTFRKCILSIKMFYVCVQEILNDFFISSTDVENAPTKWLQLNDMSSVYKNFPSERTKKKKKSTMISCYTD